MPRFYFHLRNDLDVPDNEGTELSSIEAAHKHAACLVRFEVSQGVMRDGRLVLSHRIDIEDEQRRILDSVWFRDALQLED